MSQQLTTVEIIRRIETHKHDLSLLLRDCVFTPINIIINREGRMSDTFWVEQSDKANAIYHIAKEIADFFGSKWYDYTLTDDSAKLQSLRKNIHEFITIRISQVDNEIIPFYKKCQANHLYFNGELPLNDAHKALREAISDWSFVKTKLYEMNIYETSLEVNDEKCSLLELLQDYKYGLDTINDAIVHYVNEVDFSDIKISIDKGLFLQHVLQNITKNIAKHAFGIPKYKSMRLTHKRVVVSFEKHSQESVIVLIKNNGQPFDGDISKIFDYGYCYGDTKGTGIGLNSLRNHMHAMGGDIAFYSEDGWVTYKLTFKR